MYKKEFEYYHLNIIELQYRRRVMCNWVKRRTTTSLVFSYTSSTRGRFKPPKPLNFPLDPALDNAKMRTAMYARRRPSGSALVSINEVNLRRARLVLRWVTVSGFNSRWGTSVSVRNQPPRSTQPGHPFVDRRNEYQPKGGDAWRLRLGSKGRYGSCVGGTYEL